MVAMMTTPVGRSFGTAILRSGNRRQAVLPTAAPPPSCCLSTGDTAIRRTKSTLVKDDPHSHSSHSLLILGKPGGGKGTISGKILSDFPQFRHVSTGDELRRHVRLGTELGMEAKKYMDEGSLVPDRVMIDLVMGDAMEAVKSGQSLLLDGFPRTMEQAVALDRELDVDMVINLDVPNDVIIERISDRWIHPASGRIYSYSYKPPKVTGLDDETGEVLVQRDDDKPESVLRRLEKYDAVTHPLVEYYEKKGVIQTFRGTESDVIYPEVKQWLDDQLYVEIASMFSHGIGHSPKSSIVRVAHGVKPDPREDEDVKKTVSV